jgi:hypothetical protein
VFLSENPVKKLQDLSHEQNVVLFALLWGEFLRSFLCSLYKSLLF